MRLDGSLPRKTMPVACPESKVHPSDGGSCLVGLEFRPQRHAPIVRRPRQYRRDTECRRRAVRSLTRSLIVTHLGASAGAAPALAARWVRECVCNELTPHEGNTRRKRPWVLRSGCGHCRRRTVQVRGHACRWQSPRASLEVGDWRASPPRPKAAASIAQGQAAVRPVLVLGLPRLWA